MNGKKNLQRFLLGLLVLLFGTWLAADGFIVIPHPHPRPHHPPDFQPFPLEVKYHNVDVNIEDQVAITSIDQAFYNPTSRRLEGFYLFPIPKNAVIKKFSMLIDGKEVEAELLDAVKAKRIYEDIVRRQRDPALLEYTGQGVLKARIFPIEPHSTREVKISYREILSKESGTLEYLYPLNTEKFSAKPLKNVGIRVKIHGREKIKNIYCPTHEVEIVRKGDNRALVSYEERDVKPHMDFKLYFTSHNDRLGFSLLTHKKKGDDGFFFLSLSPGFQSIDKEVVEKDIAFVLDVSGSMAGEKLKQAKNALLFCIENLNKGDRFEIIRFSTEAEGMFGGLQPVTAGNLVTAREFVNDLRAMGGTNIDEALSMALDHERKGGRPYMVIFLTDGKPTIGETHEDALLDKIKKRNHQGTRIFTFGIGNEINTHLLDKITDLTRAYRTYISPQEDIEIKISDFYGKVQSPVLTDLKMDFGPSIQISKTYPRDLPDLFKGSSITLLGRYRGSGKVKVVLSGVMGDKGKQFEFSGDFSGGKENDFIPPLWAARRIGYLLDQVRLQGKEKELVDEITDLARTYGIITPYTSYLILEDESDNVRRRVIAPEDQTLGRAAGTNVEFKKQAREEYANVMKKTGSGSVQASKDVQQMNKALNVEQTQPGKGRLNFTQEGDKDDEVSQRVKNIQGRAIYWTGQTWIDSRLQTQKNQQVQRIQFAGEDYFKFLQQEPQAAQFLALGKNLRFVFKGITYEIYE